MTKKLTLESFNQMNDKYNQMKTITAQDKDGEKYSIDVYEYFRPTLVDEVATEYLFIIDELTKEKLKSSIDKYLKDSIYLVPVLALRKFTDMPIPHDCSPQELVGISIVLADSDLLFSIMQNIDGNEFNKVQNKINELKLLGNKIGEAVAFSTLNNGSNK